ncbi:hypothetical protein BJ912DRAFT_493996 [Pholiota molesta]|nr:hypothetical protein BJ912DRAFT_493996 [Pholiota molesta]
MFNSLARCSRIISQLNRRRAQHLPLCGPVRGMHVRREWLGDKKSSASPGTVPAQSAQNDDAVILRTLQPDRLATAGQQIIDLSEISFPAVYPLTITKPIVLSYATTELPPFVHKKVQQIPFPQNTRGFFYYHSDPNEPELRAGVRFRICDRADRFAEGHDLLDPYGDAWGYTLPDLTHHLRQGSCR